MLAWIGGVGLSMGAGTCPSTAGAETRTRITWVETTGRHCRPMAGGGWRMLRARTDLVFAETTGGGSGGSGWRAGHAFDYDAAVPTLAAARARRVAVDADRGRELTTLVADVERSLRPAAGTVASPSCPHVVIERGSTSATYTTCGLDARTADPLVHLIAVLRGLVLSARTVSR